ncbi:MAG: hypothetical protein K2H41_15030 [Acetatifactor sp.]|nr:hypothetical protein [Acetatifactor sp.]
MHGESEKKCFDVVIQSIFRINSFNKKLPHEVSEEDFLKERVFYQQPGVVEKFFGLSEADAIKIERTLRAAMPNPKISEFPDFVSNLGFVEHFHVTSSMTNRKGSFHKKEETFFMERVGREEEQFKNEMNENPSFEEVKSIHHTFSFPKHSHEYFVKSFINIWNKHMDSYEKYQGIKEISVFMIEYQDMALRMREDFGKIKCEVWYGDMLCGHKRYDYYRLSRDVELLNFVYKFKDKINFVIMVCGNNVEIICVENIPELLKLIPYKYEIYAPSVMCKQTSLYGISVPDIRAIEDGENCE